MINLEHLTEQERKIIMDVLQRDEQLRQSEQERVKKLKTELHELRRKSAVKVDEDSVDSGKKVCARCREPLGTIFNSGEVCPRCQHKVCSSCKVLLPNTKKWLCTICNKHLQIRLESGEAFGPKGEGQAEAYGTDLVKMSLAKNKTGRDPIVHVNGGPQSPADSGFHGRGGANVPSVGESNSTTFDEDYPSDVSYEQSMVESIGPSVSQRGTVVSNGVEGGVHGTADITMERIPSRNGSPATSRRGRQGGEAADYSQYEKSRSRQSHSPAGSRRNLHGAELSEDERSYRSNGSAGRGMSGHPSIPTIAIQDAGESSFSEGEYYYSGSERLHRQALEANMYRSDEEIHQTLELSTQNPEFSQLPNNEEGTSLEEEELEIGKSYVSFCEVDQSSLGESQDEMVGACVITTNTVIENEPGDSLKEMTVDQKQQVICHEEDTMDDTKSPSNGPNIERSELDNLALRETEEGLLLATASGVVQQVLIRAKRQMQEEIRTGKGEESPQGIVSAMQPEVQDSAEGAMASLQPERSPDAADPDVPVAFDSSLEAGASASMSKSPGQPEPSTATIKIMTDLTGAGPIRELKLSQELFKGSSSSLTSLYSTGEEFYGKYPITGDVSFGLGYNFKTNVFEVKIGGCRDLVPIDAKKNKSDPYIKTYLLPDKSKNSKRKTRTKKGTINPNYSENLKYPIAQSELETRTLSVAIWNYDRFGHNMFLGEVLLPLDGIDLTSYPVKWHQLKTRVPPNETKPISYKGDIVLALMFETLLDENKNGTSGSKSTSLRRKKKGPSSKVIGGSLKIHIKEAKNLSPPRVGAVVNPYVKVYLEPDRSKANKKKTSTMRNTLNPSYEQSLEFPNVTEDILKERALEVGIWDSEIGSSSLLGGVRLGSGTGKSYGRSVEWQDSTGIEIQLWEEMLRNHNQWVEACLTLRASFDKDKKT